MTAGAEGRMINAAIVGLGNWGRNLVEHVQGMSPKIRFVAGCTRTVDKSHEFAEQKGIPITADYAAILAVLLGFRLVWRFRPAAVRRS